MSAIFPGPSLALWTGAVSLYLEHYAGRPLADAPVYMLRPLPEWHARGWAAHDVAERLAECRWPQPVTLVRYYTDRRPGQVLAAIARRYSARQDRMTH